MINGWGIFVRSRRKYGGTASSPGPVRVNIVGQRPDGIPEEESRCCSRHNNVVLSEKSESGHLSKMLARAGSIGRHSSGFGDKSVVGTPPSVLGEFLYPTTTQRRGSEYRWYFQSFRGGKHGVIFPHGGVLYGRAK